MSSVDNTSSVVYNEKRYSSKLYSKKEYDIGTVWVMDATHTPYGCSVWPALFTREYQRHYPHLHLHLLEDCTM